MAQQKFPVVYHGMNKDVRGPKTNLLMSFSEGVFGKSSEKAMQWILYHSILLSLSHNGLLSLM